MDSKETILKWKARAEQGRGPGEMDGDIAILQTGYEPLEIAVTAACPFCGQAQPVHAWKRGVAQTGQKCRWCYEFVATGCWEAVSL